MPGLIRGVARTAVVAGTATAVSNRVQPPAGRPVGGAGAAASLPAQPPPQAYPPLPAAGTTSSRPTRNRPPHRRRHRRLPLLPPSRPPADEDMDSKLLQLRQLGELKTQGILTEAEFEAQKRKILGV